MPPFGPRRDTRDQGFTLIELLVVIIIIGILAAIAVPVFLNQRKKADTAAIKSDLRSVAQAMETAYVDTRAYPSSLPAGVRLSPGVTVTLAGLSGNDARFADFVARCKAVSTRCDYNEGLGSNGGLWLTWVRQSDGFSTSSAYSPGQTPSSDVATYLGWTGPIPSLPTTPVTAGASTDDQSFCLTGTAASSPSEQWHWDSKSGGLAKGPCA